VESGSGDDVDYSLNDYENLKEYIFLWKKIILRKNERG
jgi:hypothetical protein